MIISTGRVYQWLHFTSFFNKTMIYFCERLLAKAGLTRLAKGFYLFDKKSHKQVLRAPRSTATALRRAVS